MTTTQRKLQKSHIELIAIIVCGLLLLLAIIFPAASVPLFIAAYVVGGYHKAMEGIAQFIRERSLNVEILMIAAAIGAAIIGYWQEGAILIFIFALSGVMETYTMKKSERDLSKLIELQPNEATRVIDGVHKVVPVSELAVGDDVLIKPGERIPIDGTVTQGNSTIDESPITGESLPVSKKNGDPVYAGTLNIDGSMMIKVTKKNEDTLFQKIVHLVLEAQQQAPASQQFIDRFEKIYVHAVLLIVALMFFVPHYAFGWSWQETSYRALVLLVVASPCALVASISPAVLSALSYSARNAVLFKSGQHIEKLASIRVIAMDKTGTITKGQPQVRDYIVQNGMDEATFWSAVYGLEQHSTHPLAKSIVDYATTNTHIEPMTFNTVTDVPGKGIHGVNSEGEKWSIGSARFIGEDDARRFLDEQSDSKPFRGKSIVFVRHADRIAGAIAIEDVVRDEAKVAIQDLHKQGIKIIMISGDHTSVAEKIAGEVGIDEFVGEALPDEKMELIDAYRKRDGAIMMIGDGINDAPSLAKADIGVAMGSGTDIAMETADVILVKNNLQKVSDAIRVSKKMNRIIKQNIVFSLAVILLLIIANFNQTLTLPIGVLGHEGSTILVILNGLRLLKGGSNMIFVR